MNKFIRSKNTRLILVAAVVLAVFFTLYTFLLKPLTGDVEAKQFEVNRLSTEVFSLKNELDELEQVNQEIPADVYKLRKKIPQQSAINELILQFEEIEYISKVRLESIGFNNYDVDVSQAEMEQPVEATITGSKEDLETLGLTEEEMPISTINVADLPADLKLLTYELHISANSEERIKRFLKEIEQLERIMKIDAISYTLPGEGQDTELDDLAIQASMRVSAFYYEGDY